MLGADHGKAAEKGGLKLNVLMFLPISIEGALTKHFWADFCAPVDNPDAISQRIMPNHHNACEPGQ